MSYTKLELNGIICDSCKENYLYEHDGICAWFNKRDAYERASDNGWRETEDEKHYCPKCYEVDNDDNLIIKILK